VYDHSLLNALRGSQDKATKTEEQLARSHQSTAQLEARVTQLTEQLAAQDQRVTALGDAVHSERSVRQRVEGDLSQQMERGRQLQDQCERLSLKVDESARALDRTMEVSASP